MRSLVSQFIFLAAIILYYKEHIFKESSNESKNANNNSYLNGRAGLHGFFSKSTVYRLPFKRKIIKKIHHARIYKP